VAWQPPFRENSEICHPANFYLNIPHLRNISLAHSANFIFAEQKFHILPGAKYFTATPSNVL
jgi:hypothetical protein